MNIFVLVTDPHVRNRMDEWRKPTFEDIYFSVSRAFSSIQKRVCVHVRLKEADTSRGDDLISLDARRNRSLRAVMAKECCFVRTIKGLSCYLLAVMEVMLLTVLCSHFMRINVAPPVCQLSPSRGSNAKGYVTRNIIIIRHHPFPSCRYSSD